VPCCVALLQLLAFVRRVNGSAELVDLINSEARTQYEEELSAFNARVQQLSGAPPADGEDLTPPVPPVDVEWNSNTEASSSHVRTEAETARKQLQALEDEEATLQGEVSSLEEDLKADYGPNQEFWSLRDRCIENTASKCVAVCGVVLSVLSALCCGVAWLVSPRVEEETKRTADSWCLHWLPRSWLWRWGLVQVQVLCVPVQGSQAGPYSPWVCIIFVSDGTQGASGGGGGGRCSMHALMTTLCAVSLCAVSLCVPEQVVEGVWPGAKQVLRDDLFRWCLVLERPQALHDRACGVRRQGRAGGHRGAVHVHVHRRVAHAGCVSIEPRQGAEPGLGGLRAGRRAAAACGAVKRGAYRKP